MSACMEVPVGKACEYARRTAGLGRRELSVRLGHHPTWAYAVEHGDNPALLTLCRVAAAAGLDVCLVAADGSVAARVVDGDAR